MKLPHIFFVLNDFYLYLIHINYYSRHKGGINIKKTKIIFFVLSLLLITGGIVIFYNHSYAKETPKATQVTQEELKEIEEINEKITETELSEKIINALKENGYDPHGGIAYTIYSVDKKT
ncbi:hypothetical protein JFL43_13940 [Viridibacillus sp. YIM B01967]|uniref:Uncharacterized protein n=1 Tax=Viridibacillus soli TaxID=2798301 RepID=A0ABS1H943_9BACL|nr:hypothetical protein [Viridibacillus soli]MBK3495941.1 hypothetical protein [Viridibacillus soli]